MTTKMAVVVSPHSRPARRRPRLRTAVLATLAAILLSLVASAPTASASATVPEKKCVDIKDDYDLRNAARENDVIVVIYEKDERKERDEICNKVTDTLDKAWDGNKGTVFASLEVEEPSEDHNGDWQAGNKGFVKGTLGVKGFPAFVFVSKGMDRNSKFSKHVTHYNGSEDTLDLADVEKFIEKKAGFQLGNNVYNIIFFDTVAARFVSYGTTTPWTPDRIKQRSLAILVRISTLFSFKEPFSSIGKLYNRAFAMSLEHGMDYPDAQYQKLQKRLDAKKSSLSADKTHEFQQKMAILKAFAEPKELTWDEDKQILIHSVLHIGLLVATLLLFFLPSDEETKKDGEEVVNDEPVVAKTLKEDESEKKTE